MKESAQPLLEPGEQIEEIFPARTAKNALGGIFPTCWVIAVTDRSIVILSAKRMSETTPRSVAERLPRDTKLGPTKGAMFANLSVTVESKRLAVQRRFFEDVERADAR